jgi:hypothetical protein
MNLQVSYSAKNFFTTLAPTKVSIPGPSSPQRVATPTELSDTEEWGK